MRGGPREGAGRHPKSKEEKKQYIVKTIKFKENEKFLIDSIESYSGKNFSEKLKNVLITFFEKK